MLVYQGFLKMILMSVKAVVVNVLSVMIMESAVHVLQELVDRLLPQDVNVKTDFTKRVWQIVGIVNHLVIIVKDQVSVLLVWMDIIYQVLVV